MKKTIFGFLIFVAVVIVLITVGSILDKDIEKNNKTGMATKAKDLRAKLNLLIEARLNLLEKATQIVQLENKEREDQEYEEIAELIEGQKKKIRDQQEKMKIKNYSGMSEEALDKEIKKITFALYYWDNANKKLETLLNKLEELSFGGKLREI